MATSRQKTASVSRRIARKAETTDPLLQLPVRRASRFGAYGWARDLPDARDFLYAAPLLRFPQGLPPSVDLRSECPPVYNQGQLGSCTANGIAAAIQFDQMKQGNQAFTPSRLFIYYNERVIEHSVAHDSGAQVRDGIKSVSKLGAPPETDWPYDISKFTDKPPASAYADAKKDLVSSYSKVLQNLTQMQGCLAAGYPFVLGFTAYESFESDEVARTGVLNMPGTGETVVGGHCVLAVGYDSSARTFLIRNSWGASWGKNGYFTIPFEYLLDSQLSSDFWTIRSVTG